MDKYLSYIMSIIAACTLLFACSKAEEPETEPAKRAVTLSLSVSTRAVEVAEDISEGSHGSLKVWVFEKNSGTTLLYREYERVEWDRRDPGGEEQPEYFTSIIERLELDEEAVKLGVHVVINSESVTDGSGNPLRNVLDESTSEADLNSCVFSITDGTQRCRGNELLIYGYKEVDAVLAPDNLFLIDDLEAKRCLSRLEVYFTQNSVAADLKVKSIALAKRPATGMLVHPAEGGELPTTETDEENNAVTIFSNPDGVAVPAVLGRDVGIARFAEYYDNEDPASFTPVTLEQPILTERRGVSVNNRNGKNEGVDGTEDAYILTVTYDKRGEAGNAMEETKMIALGDVPRNTRYRVFLRVSVDVPIEVYTNIVGWEPGKGVSDPFDVTDLDFNK